ncbi:hypothetical protein lerEdw1_001545 [Lerista edwardsae]|nr:hypothetical protein lerEdw1_001545 [Lerista edwardsae]
MMKNNQRNHWECCLLGLLLLFTASGGIPLPKEDSNAWQHCKDASQKIVQKLWDSGVKRFIMETSWSFSFPPRIECNDSCDPDSLNRDKKPCLQKIGQRLQQYHDLLSLLSESESKPIITDLQLAVGDLLKHFQKKEEGRSPRSHPHIAPWQFELLRNETLWRLQSFSVVVARVFAHCAAMKANHKG